MNKVSTRRAAVIIFIHDVSVSLKQFVEIVHTSNEKWEYSLIFANCTTSSEVISAIENTKGQHRNIHVIENAHRLRPDDIYQEGIHAAVNTLRADAVVIVQVPTVQSPSPLPSILEHLENSTALVLGTRKRNEDGSTTGHRTVQSLTCKIKSQIIRAILFFPTKAWFRTSDPTSPLMAFHISLYNDRKAVLHNYKPGTNYLQFLMYTLVRSATKVFEVPFHGKCEQRIKRKPLLLYSSAFRIRWRDPETKRFIKFGVVGFSGYIINAVSLEVFRHIQLTYTIARYFQRFPNLSRFALLSSQSAWSAGFAAEIAIISNYLLNNFWTFSTHTITSPFKFITKLLQFNLTSFGGIVIQFFVIGLATRIFGDTAVVRGIALVFAILFLIIPYNWTIYNRLIWRVKGQKKKNQNSNDM